MQFFWVLVKKFVPYSSWWISHMLDACELEWSSHCTQIGHEHDYHNLVQSVHVLYTLLYSNAWNLLMHFAERQWTRSFCSIRVGSIVESRTLVRFTFANSMESNNSLRAGFAFSETRLTGRDKKQRSANWEVLNIFAVFWLVAQRSAHRRISVVLVLFFIWYSSSLCLYIIWCQSP